MDASTLEVIRHIRGHFLKATTSFQNQHYYIVWHDGTLLDSNLNPVEGDPVEARLLTNRFILSQDDHRYNSNHRIYDLLTRRKYNLACRVRYYWADDTFLYAEEWGQREASTIHCYRLTDGQLMWSYGLHHLERVDIGHGHLGGVQISKFVGTSSAHLYLGLLGNQLLVLDKTTGQLQAHLTQINAYLTFLDPVTGQLFGLDKKEYWQLDAQTFALDRRSLEKHFEETGFTRQGATIYAVAFDEHYLYCASDPGFNGQFAIIDRSTLQLVWLHQFAEEWQAVPLEVYCDENWLYILDTKRTLRIFPRLGANPAHLGAEKFATFV